MIAKIEAPNLASHVDDKLMELIRSGDKSASTELFHRHQKRLENYARSIVRRRNFPIRNPEDFATMALENVILYPEKYTPTGKFFSYLTQILKNLLYDKCRYFARREGSRQHYYSDSLFKELASAEPTAAVSAEQHETAVLVRKALDGIPEIHRRAIVLHYFQGEKVEEMSELCGISIGTIKSRLRIARAKLAEKLRHLASES